MLRFYQEVRQRDNIMELAHAVFFGIGMLILAYLAFKNAGGVAQIFSAGSSGIVNVSKTLQGR